MIRWIVYARPVPGCQRKDVLSIVEVECEFISGVEDPSVMWLPNDEYKVRVKGPKFLLEPGKDGQPAEPIYYSTFLCWTLHQAYASAARTIREELERQDRKHGVPFSEEEFASKCAEIQTIRL